MSRSALHFTRAGAGPPLVLVHGLGGSSVVWEPVAERLAAEREVVAVDMPGFGRSPLLPAPSVPTPRELGRAIAALVRELGLERPHVAGNSLGGWVALEMAADGDAASVCAISPAGLWGRPLGPRASNARELGRRLRPLLAGALGSRSLRRRLLGTTFAHPERLSFRQARRVVGDWLDSPGYEVANEQMRSLVFERASEVRVPATIVWGSRDRLVGPPRRERMPPHARFRVAEGWGHTPTWDDPEGVSDLLLEASSAGAGQAPRPTAAGHGTAG